MTTGTVVRRGSGWRVALLGAVVAGAVGSACGGTTEPKEKPNEARIQVEGTSPGPLELVVSTDFFETQDPLTLEINQVIESADTTFIDLPYEETVDLGAVGSVLVNLANHDSIPANVRLRVNLDTGQSPYDRSATMSQGGSLRYVFLFIQVIV